MGTPVTYTYTYYFDLKRYERRRKGMLDRTYIPAKVEIEVNEYWYGVLKELDRQEYNDWHRENRRHVSYEKLERLNDFLIPKQFYTDDDNPVTILMNPEKLEAKFRLYDKILRGTGILSERQFQAFQYRALCEMPFDQVAYAMRFDFPTNENIALVEERIELAKKHYYNAIRKLKRRYEFDLNRLIDKYY